MIAVKLPVSSVITALGTVGIVDPRQAMVILEFGANIEPATVVVENPSSGVRDIIEGDSK